MTVAIRDADLALLYLTNLVIICHGKTNSAL